MISQCEVAMAVEIYAHDREEASPLHRLHKVEGLDSRAMMLICAPAGEGKPKITDEKQTTVYKRALDVEYRLKMAASRQVTCCRLLNNGFWCISDANGMSRWRVVISLPAFPFGALRHDTQRRLLASSLASAWL